MKIVLLICFTALSFSAFAQPKINGVALEAPPKEVDESWTIGVKQINANYVAVIPFGFSREGNASVGFNYDRQWWGEKEIGTRVNIKQAKENKLKVMLKPHLWIAGSGWVGEFGFETDDEWELWEKELTEYILFYARIAEEMDVEIYCLSTELKRSVNERPEYWINVISEVRKVYKGKLTYCSNWDNYENVTFWDKLDYIGISGYFPLVEKATPSVAELKLAWVGVKEKLEKTSKSVNRPILFTEYGYRNIDFATWKAWEVEYKKNGAEHVNNEEQVNAYQALYESLWHEKWFAGGFLWKWYLRETRFDPQQNTDWTPQNKPVEKVIREAYRVK
jgi:hypothetical protein